MRSDPWERLLKRDGKMTRIPNNPQATVPGTVNECASFTFPFIYKEQYSPESDPVDPLPVFDGLWDFIKDSKPIEKNFNFNFWFLVDINKLKIKLFTTVFFKGHTNIR